MWAITNLTAGGDDMQILTVVEAGAIKALCDLLVVKETKIVTVILDAILNILKVQFTLNIMWAIRWKFMVCVETHRT